MLLIKLFKLHVSSADSLNSFISGCMLQILIFKNHFNNRANSIKHEYAGE